MSHDLHVTLQPSHMPEWLKHMRHHHTFQEWEGGVVWRRLLGLETGRALSEVFFWESGDFVEKRIGYSKLIGQGGRAPPPMAWGRRKAIGRWWRVTTPRFGEACSIGLGWKVTHQSKTWQLAVSTMQTGLEYKEGISGLSIAGQLQVVENSLHQ